MDDELDLLKSQLDQIESLLSIDQNDELLTLKSDLQEAIKLKEAILKESIVEKSKNNSNQIDQNVNQIDKSDEFNEYSQFIGESYRVPFVLNGNQVELHEAEILKILEIDEDGDAKLLVKFLFPLNETMKCCFNCDKKDCKYLHDYVVNLSMIENSFDSNCLKKNSICLFKDDSNEYWSRGRIVDKKSNLFYVRSNLTQEIITLTSDNIVPFNEIENDNLLDNDDSIDDDKIPEPNKNEFCSWEVHTRGIGLKLLKKMNWKEGEGLGKNKSGIINPIELSILPANTSLDTCMQLKDKGFLLTTSEKFSHSKQKNYFKNLILKKNLKKLKVNDKKRPTNPLFNTINKSLEIKSKKEPINNDLKLKTIHNEIKNIDNLNFEILKTEREIKKLINEIQQFRKSLKVNQEIKNIGNIGNLKEKLKFKENELHTINFKLKALKDEKNRREFNSIKCF